MRILAYLLLPALLAAQTSPFPFAAPTDADLLNAYDRASSVLSAAIDADDMAITLADGSTFALGSHFTVTIRDERILVCSVDGPVLTVCDGGRGFAGTTPAAHSKGAAVRGTITGWHHNALKETLKAIASAYISGRAMKQINISLDDPDQSLGAMVTPSIWRAEYGPASIAKVACKADSVDEVIQIKKHGTTNMLNEGLSCGNGVWLETSSISGSLNEGDDIAVEIVSGSATKVSVSIKVNQLSAAE